ncbi:GNAT family N-acetyltransferase [Streptomyces sp. NBC_00299]|uniref:GNAT family N-acetyltransferase n=1 Tax=Streptomyces sp. NBC_00299 TaxID=2975705 RepID=UPI002E2B3557|nr:GNAT family N-acetyltransferase [Streptomyces sp. NBC_00299]
MIGDRVTAARVIRTVVPAEAETVAALHARVRAAYHPDGIPEEGTESSAAWSAAIERPEGHVLCVVEQGRIVAVASFRTPEGTPADTVKLFQFHVDPDRRGHGVGTALHAACVEEWQADRKRAAVLDVHVDNRSAQTFYAGRGWLPDPDDPPAEGDRRLNLRFCVTGE